MASVRGAVYRTTSNPPWADKCQHLLQCKWVNERMKLIFSSILEEGSDSSWVLKRLQKCKNWERLIESALLREGIELKVLTEATMAGKLTVEEALRYEG